MISAGKKYINPIVIGGGILGSSVVYHLSKLGHNTRWFEHMPHGWFSSSFASGMIIHKKNNEHTALMARQTLKDIKELEEKLDENLGFVNCGSYHFSNGGFSNKTHSQKNFYPLSVEILPKNYIYSDEDGYIDPIVLLGAYKRAAENYIDYSDAVHELLIEGSKVVGIRAGETEHFGDVIDCTGSWMGNTAIRSGIISNKSHLPIKSHYMHLKYLPSSQQLPFILTNDFYINHKGNDEYLFGIYEEKSDYYEYDLPADWTAYECINNGRLDNTLFGRLISENYGLMKNIFPEIGSVEFLNYIAGFSNYTPDGKYLVGKVCDGLYFAGGDCGSGVSSCGGIGKMVAQKLFVDEFNPTRFDKLSSNILIHKSVNSRKQKFE